MNGALFFDDLSVGDCWESHGRTVTETDIVNFACHTGDFDPLHVDHEVAKRRPFGRPVAHGLLGLAWAAGSASHWPIVQTEAFLSVHQWEFLKAIYVGDTLRVRNQVAEVTPQGRRRGRVVWCRELVNQQDEVVQRGRFETLVAGRPARLHRTHGPSEPRPHLPRANGAPASVKFSPSASATKYDSKAQGNLRKDASH